MTDTETKTKTKTQAVCSTDLHSEHLCYIMAQGLHLTDASGYEALIDPPRFRCSHCGRTARSRRNLCVPGDLGNR